LKSTVVRDFPTIPSITNLSARPGRASVRSPQRVYLLNWKARQMVMWARDYRARSWLYNNIRTARGYRTNTSSLAMWPYMELHRAIFSFVARPGGALRFATPERPPLWKGWATTGADTRCHWTQLRCRYERRYRLGLRHRKYIQGKLQYRDGRPGPARSRGRNRNHSAAQAAHPPYGQQARSSGIKELENGKGLFHQ